MNVLIIDDNLPLSFMLSQWFEFKGHTADFETDPYKALKKIQQDDIEKYDYILLDLLLNGINGMHIFEAIKEKKQEQKVIVISGCDSQTEIFQKAVEANLPIVIKTFSPEKLVKYLEEGDLSKWTTKNEDLISQNN